MKEVHGFKKCWQNSKKFMSYKKFKALSLQKLEIVYEDFLKQKLKGKKK